MSRRISLLLGSDTPDRYLELIGHWDQFGMKNDKPRFLRRDDVRLSIEWDGRGWNIYDCNKGMYPGPLSGMLPPECDGKTMKWGGYHGILVTHVIDSIAAISHKHTEDLCESLFRKRKFGDIKIICGALSFNAHSFVLVSSLVFDRMLKAPMIEGACHIITISDCSADTFNHFLEILYTGKCSAQCDWCEILILADKYQVSDIVGLCLAYMEKSFSSESAVSYFSVLNKTMHVAACEATWKRLLARACKDEAIMSAMARNC